MEADNNDVDLNVDIEAASNTLAGELGLGAEHSDGAPATSPTDEKVPGDKGAPPAPDKSVVTPKLDADGKPVSETPAKRPAPKTWAPEAHPLWEKLDEATQLQVMKREEDFHKGLEPYKADAAYGKSFRDLITPYVPMLEAAGITDHVKGVGQLLNAHFQLSRDDEGVRTNFMAQLCKSYRIDPAKLAAALTDEKPYKDPALEALEKRVSDLTTAQTSAEQKAFAEAKAKVDAEVAAFAADPAHKYFNEVADDMILLLADKRLTLKDAYDRAVWANPTTRAKEEARIREETEKKLLEDARKDAEARRRGKGVDVRGSDSALSSELPLGSMEDTMRETYRNLQSQT
jgi:hypothetical protein